ncbi:ABC transporter permease [Streptomyces scopuliridis]|uniref:ABC transporter permease n=1 Tax=Streptomyces scopuliridis TaxID=452529 RepID=UPI00343210CD
MTTPYQQPPQPQTPQQAPQWQGGPAAGYTSPIPVRRAHLGDALASEWTKLRSVRSTMWTLGVMVVLMLGIGLLTALVISSVDSDPQIPSGQEVLSLGFFGVLLGSMCVITLGVLTIASEYGTGMIRTTLTACPSRGRVLVAKSLVFFLLVFVISMVITMTVSALQLSILGAESPSGGAWLRATAGVSLYLATLGLLSLAIGALIRHSAGAITIMIGVVLLPLVLAMFMFSDSLTKLREFMFDYSIPNQMAAFYSEEVRVSGPSGWEPLWILLGVTAVAMTAAFFSLDKRDV